MQQNGQVSPGLNSKDFIFLVIPINVACGSVLYIGGGNKISLMSQYYIYKKLEKAVHLSKVSTRMCKYACMTCLCVIYMYPHHKTYVNDGPIDFNCF